MTHSTVTWLFCGFLSILVGVGIAGFAYWFKNIYPKVLRKIEQDAERRGHLSTELVALKGLKPMLPLLTVVVIFCVPVFYFNHLINQEDDCINIIQINHLKAGDEFLKRRCEHLNEAELIEKAGK